MDRIIESKYPNYDWTRDFEELPKDIDDLNFMMECRYEYEDYSIKITKGIDDKKYNIEEELYVNKEEECRELLRQLEEVKFRRVTYER